MKNKYNRNGLTYFLVLIVTVTVYLVIHFYYGGLKTGAYQCNVGMVDNKVYVTKNGDSLEDIARKYNVSVEKLMEVNHLTSNQLVPGQEIIIPVDENSGMPKQPVNSIIIVNNTKNFFTI